MAIVALWAGVVALFLIGLVGIFIPALPGIGFVFAGILLFAWSTQFSAVSIPTTILFGLLALAALAIDYIGTGVGTSFGGGKKTAIFGAIFGAIIGAFFSPLGIFAGAFLGALFGALLEGQSSTQAVKIALFSVIGVIGSSVVQFVLAITMIVAFFVAVFV